MLAAPRRTVDIDFALQNAQCRLIIVQYVGPIAEKLRPQADMRRLSGAARRGKQIRTPVSHNTGRMQHDPAVGYELPIKADARRKVFGIVRRGILQSGQIVGGGRDRDIRFGSRNAVRLGVSGGTSDGVHLN